MLAQQPIDQPLIAGLHKLMQILLEQLTTTLSSKNQAKHQQQLLLVKEHSAIAR